MKSKTNIVLAMCAVVLAIATAACHLEPYELPDEELYLRNFIKKYGLIDPDQEWNESKETVLTVELGAKTVDVTVFVSNYDKYYRVAYMAEATGQLQIPIDIPKSSETLYLLIGDAIYTTAVGGTVDATIAPEVRSRATDTDIADLTGAPDLNWVLVAEDLGTTDDFDFNDIVVGISAVTLNENALQMAFASEQWEVIRLEEHLTLENVEPGARGDSRDGTKNYKMLQIYPLAAGGTLPLYLHYKAATGSNDYIIGGASSSDAKNLTSLLNESSALNYEWHRWFGDNSGKKMINTGWPAGQGGATLSASPVQIVVDDDFSMTNYSRKFIDENDGNTSGPSHFKGDSYVPDIYNNEYTDIFGFYITVNAYTKELAQSVIAAPVPGSAPHMFLIPDFSNHTDGKWHWPIERVDITDVYPKFKDWIVNSANRSWYNDLKGTQGSTYYERDERF